MEKYSNFFKKHTVMIKNAYFFSQSFSNPTGWQQGGESGNSFVAYNETTWSEIQNVKMAK
jgi:hypothetical protein